MAVELQEQLCRTPRSARDLQPADRPIRHGADHLQQTCCDVIELVETDLRTGREEPARGRTAEHDVGMVAELVEQGVEGVGQHPARLGQLQRRAHLGSVSSRPPGSPIYTPAPRHDVGKATRRELTMATYQHTIQVIDQVQIAIQPSSIGSSTPVIQDDTSAARKRTVLAISRGKPMRPIG
nr:hypothetical protein [Frankia sp. R43]